jgi:hypothetical protein
VVADPEDENELRELHGELNGIDKVLLEQISLKVIHVLVMRRCL